MIDAVALASIRLEAVAINNRELAVVIANQAGALELSGDSGDPGTAHAKHGGEEFLRERHRIRLNAVESHEQPPRAPLLDRMEPIASRGLRGEVKKRFDEAQRNPANGLALIKCCLAAGRHSCAAQYLESAR